MSPTEFELRGALHDGEGEDGPLDISAVILRAEAIRRERRVRLVAVAAAAIVVVGVSGALVITHRTPSRTTAAGANAAGSAALAPSTARQDLPYDAAAPASVSSVPSHDVSAEHISAPTSTTTNVSGGTVGTGGNLTTQAATCPATVAALPDPPASTRGEPMFSAPVVSMIACGYLASDGAQLTDPKGDPLLSVLSQADVAATVASINAASTAPVPIPCSNFAATNGEVVLYAQYADGPAIRVVSSVNPCDRTISNGVAERYNWTPPTALQQFEDQIKKAS